MDIKKIYFKIGFCFIIVVFSSFQIASAQGATMPFDTYEAEDGSLENGATILAMTSLPLVPTVELESSGRKCVNLNATAESVSWITLADANTIVVRASIPDAPTGGGITATLNLYVNAVFRQALTFTSKYSWVYGANAFTDNNPATGTPKKFYDQSRAFIAGTIVPSGSTITLKKEASNTADYYNIDLIQLENVAAALPQPPNTLSIVNYGAIANDDIDDTNAIKSCVSACQSQGKVMWIPPGVFNHSGRITANGIGIYGAGMWYSTIQPIMDGTQHALNLANCNVQDLYIDNRESGRDVAQGHDYGVLMKGAKGWTIQRVWVHRGGACFWCSGTDGLIQDCRATESWADGINLNNGPVVDSDKLGIRLTAQNNYIIGSGDDGIAINAQNGGGIASNMLDIKVINNTSIAAFWANGMRVAGGRNSIVAGNLITDPTSSNGIRIGEFGVNGNPCESVLVKDNLILRGCGIRTNYGHGGIAVCDDAVATINSNIIWDSPGIGIDVQSSNATYTSNVIINSALQGILIKSGSTGNAVFTTNTVANLSSGQLAYRNDASSGIFTTNLENNSWQTVGVVFYGENNYAGTPSQTLSIGNYTKLQLLAIGCPNDWASSVKVPDGFQVELYSEDNFNGQSLTLMGNASTLSTYNFDKAVSSIKINNLTTSVKTLNEDQNKKITIYPNPVSDILHIGGIEGATLVTIRNLTGKIIFNSKTSGIIGVSDLSAGIYFLTIGSDSSYKFIKK